MTNHDKYLAKLAAAAALGMLISLAGAGCAQEPTAPEPIDPAVVAAEAAKRAACTQAGVVPRARQGSTFVDNWFSEDVVALHGDPVNAERASLDASCGYPAAAAWSHVSDSTALPCTLFGLVGELRGASLRCVGNGVVVVILRHNGFTGQAAYLVSDVGVRRSAAIDRDQARAVLDAASPADREPVRAALQERGWLE
jgi:hypothetical protein